MSLENFLTCIGIFSMIAQKTYRQQLARFGKKCMKSDATDMGAARAIGNSRKGQQKARLAEVAGKEGKAN